MALPERDHRISAEEKQELVNNAFPQDAESDGSPESFSFHLDQVKKVVDQEGADIFVISKGKSNEGEEVVILSAKTNSGEELPVILELSFPCPPFCG